MQSIQNLGLAVITQVAGIIVDSNGYLILEVFFIGWLCGKIVVKLFLCLGHFTDTTTGSPNKQTNNKRADLEKKKKPGD